MRYFEYVFNMIYLNINSQTVGLSRSLFTCLVASCATIIMSLSHLAMRKLTMNFTKPNSSKFELFTCVHPTWFCTRRKNRNHDGWATHQMARLIVCLRQTYSNGDNWSLLVVAARVAVDRIVLSNTIITSRVSGNVALYAPPFCAGSHGHHNDGATWHRDWHHSRREWDERHQRANVRRPAGRSGHRSDAVNGRSLDDATIPITSVPLTTYTTIQLSLNYVTCQ